MATQENNAAAVFVCEVLPHENLNAFKNRSDCVLKRKQKRRLVPVVVVVADGVGGDATFNIDLGPYCVEN